MNGPTSPSSEDPVAYVASKITEYLLSHPAALDTTEGIANWWVGDAVQPIFVVVEALERLVQQGLLREVKASGRIMYGLCERPGPDQ